MSLHDRKETMTYDESSEQFPIGSTWYAYGHHWRIIGYSTRDGEPSLRMTVITPRVERKYKKVKHNVIARLFARKALPTNTHTHNP